MSSIRPALTDQHLYLRLLIMLMALVGNLGSSLRQLLLQIALFLLFSLLDLHSLSRLLRALKLIISFLAAYWLFATLLGTPFPTMLLFSLRLVFFAQVSVYTFSHLSIPRVLHDCSSLLKYHWGRGLILYLSATVMFTKTFRHRWMLEADSDMSLGDRFSKASHASLEDGDAIAARLEAALADPDSYRSATPASGLIGLALLSLMVLIGAF